MKLMEESFSLLERLVILTDRRKRDVRGLGHERKLLMDEEGSRRRIKPIAQMPGTPWERFESDFSQIKTANEYVSKSNLTHLPILFLFCFVVVLF